MSTKKLFLIDAMSLIYRAYFAMNKIPRLTSKGLNTSAILGFTNMLLKVIESEKPTHIAMAFDHPSPTFRHKTFQEYKANRPKQPEDLTLSIPYIKKIVAAFKIPMLEEIGYEADDLIGTIAKRAVKEDFIIYIVSSDKDFAQLVEDKILLYKIVSNGNPKIIDKNTVLEEWGINSVDQVRDILAIRGDSSDNIPGIPSIGEKIAQKLIQTFGSVENLISNATQLSGKLKENVIKYSQQGLMSKELATIFTAVPIVFNLESSLYTCPDQNNLTIIFEELEFKSLQKRLFGKESLPLKSIENTKKQYRFLNTYEERQELAKTLAVQLLYSFHLETIANDNSEEQLVGIAFAYSFNEAYYIPIPIDHESARKLLTEFTYILENEVICKIGHDMKNNIKILRRYGLYLSTPIFDVTLAQHLINSEERYSLSQMSENYLKHTTVFTKEKWINNMVQSNSDTDAKDYSCESADVILQLYHQLTSEINNHNLNMLLNDVELPLVYVLADMEYVGVRINTDFLKNLSKTMEENIERLSNIIYTLAGTKFNIDSPKQLGKILFEKLKLTENPSKTSSGQYSTEESILKKYLITHSIVPSIIEYREIKKLKNTYIDVLPNLVNPIDKRIHTTYNQTITITGRLSSSNPNLQNIPIKTTMGREIRKAFIPSTSNGFILSADYSQIELRILASFSNDPILVEAFEQHKDIHLATASKLFGLPIDQIDKDMRRKAKTANFGIIYGISPYGLSQSLAIPVKEATSLINSYFEEFYSIKQYMDEVIQKTRKDGYVTTFLGRKRWLKDINSKSSVLKAFAERNAINTPIQGTAAEMIKIAMINVNKCIKKEKLNSKLIMQVHDELVFDVCFEEKNQIIELIPHIMRSAIKLRVPIEVTMNIGNSWFME